MKQVREVVYYNQDDGKDLARYVLVAPSETTDIEAKLAFKHWFIKTQPKPSALPISIRIDYEEWKPEPWK